jgi:subfamily B ATP-binding cassette protein MsbA
MSHANEIGDAAKVYRRLLAYVRDYWKAVAVAFAAMAGYAATDTGFAAMMQPMIDGSFVRKDPHIIMLIPFLLILLFFLRGVTGFISSYCMAWVGRKVIKDMRAQMFDHLIRLPAAFYDNNSSGKLISKFTYDVEQVYQASTNTVTILIRDSLTVIGLVAWMFYINWSLAAIFFLVGPPIAYTVNHVNKRFRRVSNRIQSSMGDVTHTVEEAISGQRVIKTFGAQEYESRRFARINESNRHQNMKLATASAASSPIIQFISALALSGVIFIATRQSMLESISVGSFMSFVAAMMMLLAPIKRLSNVNAPLQRGIVAAHSAFNLIDSDMERDTGTVELSRARGAIEYRGVSFRYAPEKACALREVDITIEPGQTVAVVGRSGSGKSTFISLLPRFYDPTAGVVTLDGHDLRDLTLDSLRRQIAWVGQDVMLFNDTIAGNITYGRHGDVSEEDIVRAAETAHAMEFIRQLPGGLDAVIGERGVLLSGGQRQRLAIARALLKDAPVLILDEATSSLDTESERYIQAGLETLMKNRTTLVIAHRLSTIERADVIIVLEQGRIIETGSHQQLLAHNGHYANLYNLQFRHDRPPAATHPPATRHERTG